MVQSVELYMTEAMRMYDILLKDMGNPVEVLAHILPYVATIQDARRLIDIYIGDNAALVRSLSHQMGTMLQPIIGNFTGFYMLDLTKPSDKICFSKLLERSNMNTYYRKKDGLGDISQEGDWSSFRNGVLDRTSCRITATTYDAIPSSGRLEFDFVDADRLGDFEMQLITDHDFIDLLMLLKLIPPSSATWAQEQLDIMTAGVCISMTITA